MVSIHNTLAEKFPAQLGEAIERQTRYRWVVLSVLAASYFLGSADRANLGVALPYIKQEFQLSNTEAGTVASLFFLGATLVQIPGSLLIQRFNIRRVMVWSILLSSLATFFTGISKNIHTLFLSRFLLGAAEGPLPVGGVSAINRWFPIRERATAVGLYVATFKLAQALVPPVAAAIIYAFGWRAVFYFFAIPGIFIAALWYFVDNDPRACKRTSSEEADYIESDVKGNSPTKMGKAPVKTTAFDRLIRVRTVRPLETNRQVLKSLNLWGCTFSYFLLAGLTYAILTWVPTYLVEEKGFSIMKMGFVAAAPWVGAMLGAVAGGLLSDRFFYGRRKPVMLITTFSTIFTMYALASAPNNTLALTALLGATGFLLNVGFSTFQVYTMGLADKRSVPFALSICSTFGSIGALSIPVTVGFILDNFNWGVAFGFLSTCAVAAFVLTALIIEPIQERHNVQIE